MALGTTLLLSSLFAAFMLLCVVFVWDLKPQDLSSHQNAFILPLILMLSVCGGLGGGVLAFALTNKKTEE